MKTLLAAALAGVVALTWVQGIGGQTGASATPKAAVTEAPPTVFPSDVDSNSPAYWEVVRGVPSLHVVTSFDGQSALSVGPNLTRLRPIPAVNYTLEANGGRWMEAVLQAPDGTLYGYYHNEPGGVCDLWTKTAPRIGAARSFDGGETWEDLGIILDAPAGSYACDSPNYYFVGGVGDFSAVLDQDGDDVYFVFSTYGRALAQQGVALARMAWADRDEPVGNVAVWQDGIWVYPDVDALGNPIHRAATPIYMPAVSWHAEDELPDAFWGPSVHWNTHLQQYVILLNRTADLEWTQEGVYVAFAPRIDDPSSWSSPGKLLDTDRWYPQVMGLEVRAGTDKLAGERARLYLGGRSDHFVVFSAP